MHNIDMTQGQLARGGACQTFEFTFDRESGETGEYAGEFEEEYEGEAEGEWEGPFSEMETMELASELLEIRDEAEMEQFLGDLVKKAASAVGSAVSGAARAVSNFAKTPTGQALTGVLKQAAGAALPIIGTAAGGLIGGPAGAALGGKAASALGQAFGLELEGLSYEDQHFEVAQQFVRMAGAATQNAVTAPPGTSPQEKARAAVIEAAKTFAPGLIRPASQGNGQSLKQPNGKAGGQASTMTGHAGAHRQGRWLRHGSRIILLGV
jgi:hypothetical protein